MNRKKESMKPCQNGVAKVPVIIQMEALECGAASLSMILAYYGKWVPLAQARIDCGVSRDGSNAKNIAKAAMNYGLQVKAYRYEVEEVRKKVKFPCIIHWNFNHFVVLSGFRHNGAVINDPARGNIVVSEKEFDQSFTGICLTFEPGEQFVPSGKAKSIASYAKDKLSREKASFVLIVMTTMISSIIALILAGFSRVFTDYLLSGSNLEWFVPFMLLIVAAAVIQIIAEWINAAYSTKINGKLAIGANAEYMWHVLRLPMEFFSQRLAGDLVERKQENTTIAKTLVFDLAPLVIKGLMIFIYLVVIIRYSLVLAVIGVCAIVANLLLSQIISRKKINITRVSMRERGKLVGTTIAGIEMIETIKSSGAENGFFDKWAGYQANVSREEAKYARIDSCLGMFPKLINVVSTGGIFMGSIYLVMQGNWTIGMMTAFLGFLEACTNPAMELIEESQSIQEMRNSLERVDDIMEYPADVEYHTESKAEASEEISYAKLTGKIEMRHVTFGYSKLAPPLIEDFSMEIEPGQRVAFVGGSGCGKSTIVKLLSGLYQPDSGEILFDGKPLTDINHNVFTGSLSVVDQDIVLFEDTIANNIKMWDNSIEDFEMILAARDAQLHEDIMQRDGGYQYSIMEGGKDLSGGQRQRLEIARVLAQDPTIIVMDEATSALDAVTEYNTVKSIKDRGITCIVIAHRLSTIKDCDEIIVMDHGKVKERGTHEELYAQDGIYKALISNE